MKIRLIKNDKDYEDVLGRIDQLLNATPGSPQEDELILLAILVENFEDRHYPIPLPDPIEAIKFRMEQQELRPKDLVPYIGSASKVSEVLSGKRALSLAMIRKLCTGLGISAEVLVQEPKKQSKASKRPAQASKGKRVGARIGTTPR